MPSNNAQAEQRTGALQPQPMRPVGTANKGLGVVNEPLLPSDVASRQWHLLREDLSLPTAVLYEDTIAHNLAWMQRFTEAYHVHLAPHGKTTMAPSLFHRQLRAGAWGITLATAQQTLAAYEHGVKRVLMANQLVGRQNMAIIARLIQDPEFEFFCLVDSPQQVKQLAAFFGSIGDRRLHVLVELGVAGGRAGVRDERQLSELVSQIEECRQQIALAGVEVYEGVLSDEDSVRKLLHRAVSVARSLASGNRLDRHPIILSGAGSAWYDVVADVFSKAEIGMPVDVVLRPGCYLTHDVGIYREAQSRIFQRNPIAKEMHSGLKPALQLWAYVQSIPEPKRAIVGLGKRDAAFDAGLPVPALHYRPGQSAMPSPANPEWKLVKLMDQHAYLQIEHGADLQVGDMLGFDISHPCLTFDKWRYLPILDSEYRVIDLVETFF